MTRQLPLTHEVTPPAIASLVVALLITLVSTVGLRWGSNGLYGFDPNVTAGVTASTAGVLVPGFQAHDLFNLLVGLPILLGTLWLTRRGLLLGLLLWPGALFYLLYTYALYLVGAPFSILFVPHATLVALSAFTTIALVASIDGVIVQQQLAAVVPARIVGALLVALGCLTLGQDAGGAIATALGADIAADPVARHVWTVDLALEVPAMLLGGVLLWRRHALGYVVGGGLLFQFGLTPLGLAAMLALQPFLTGAPVEMGTVMGVLIFSIVSFAPLIFFGRNHPVAPGTSTRMGGGQRTPRPQ
jgi:hypothetical protein